MRKVFLWVFTGFLAVIFIAGSLSYAGTIEVVSVDSAGKLGNNDSYDSSISADGRFVAFFSNADNLVPGDTNNKADVFVRDRQTGKTEIISIDNSGKPANDNSYDSAISADGRFVAFRSLAGNLVPGDTNNKADVFVHDRQTGKTEIISIDNSGKPGNDTSSLPAISADGRFVAFESEADNLVPGDANNKADAFLRDRQTGKTEIISTDSAGITGAGSRCIVPAISADGRFVAFESQADNLVLEDTNGKFDVFVRDRQ